MESYKIEKLIEKYFEATTTVAEEDALRIYFAQNDVAKHLEEYTPIFQYFSSAKEEEFTKQVPLRSIESATNKKVNYKWLSVAAVGILMLGIYFGNSYRERRNQEKEAAAYAYQETKKALYLLSQNFNRGTKKVAHLNKFEKTKQKIYNN